MPILNDFECDTCGKTIEQLVDAAAKSMPCPRAPTCTGTAHRRLGVSASGSAPPASMRSGAAREVRCRGCGGRLRPVATIVLPFRIQIGSPKARA